MTVSIGDRAPEFTLPGTGGRSYSLADYLGKSVVLVFYPGDNTAVCTKQLCSYTKSIDEFNGVGAQVLGISPQSVDSHEQFSHRHNFGFPLLADIDKEVSALYGVIGPLGFSRRSVFVVDGKGIIRYAHRALTGLSYRPAGELVAAVRAAIDGS
ncbi:MAG: peroxiredoxin [Ilumatobacteraceae bacterium]